MSMTNSARVHVHVDITVSIYGAIYLVCISISLYRSIYNCPSLCHGANVQSFGAVFSQNPSFRTVRLARGTPGSGRFTTMPKVLLILCRLYAVWEEKVLDKGL